MKNTRRIKIGDKWITFEWNEETRCNAFRLTVCLCTHAECSTQDVNKI